MLLDILDNVGGIICLVILALTSILWIGQAIGKKIKSILNNWSRQSRQEERFYYEHEDEWLKIHRD